MPHFEVDYTNLDNTLTKRSYRMTAKQLADRGMERVAFDVVRFSDGDMASKLWEVNSADDGDYIVSLYDEPEVEKTASTKVGGWEVIVSKASNTLNVFYKGNQLASLSATKLGIPTGELSLIERYLPGKLATDRKLVASLIKELPEPSKVYTQYPELA